MANASKPAIKQCTPRLLSRPFHAFSVMRKVPNGSAVVFVLGEIDCREGILVAVEKLRYETPEEGAEHTIGIFIEVCTYLSTALCLL